MPSRRRAREQALQVLFFSEVSRTPATEALDLFRRNFKSGGDDFPYARHLVEGVSRTREKIDSLIEKHSDNWKMSRMPRIDRNILRLGAFELAECPDVPAPVALDEAIELAKKYGEAETGAFVNGVLDKISKEVRG